MPQLVVALLNVLTLVGILTLVALGLAIIFGLMDIVNLAHGEFVTIGAFTLAVLQPLSGGHHSGVAFGISLVIAPVIGAGFGLLVEAMVIRPLYARP